MDFRSWILWDEFHNGQPDVAQYIKREWDNHYALHGAEWNPKLEEWEEGVKDWWNSDDYEKDRATYKPVYDLLIPYYNDDEHFDDFTFRIEFPSRIWQDDIVTVEIYYDKRGDNYNDTHYIEIKGTRATIAEEISKALRYDANLAK